MSIFKSTGYLRPIELLAVGIILISALGVGYLLYFPLENNNKELGRLAADSSTLRTEIGKLKDTQRRYEHINDSTKQVVDKIQGFEKRFLQDGQKGRLALVDEINKLVKDNSLSLGGTLKFDTIKEISVEEAAKNFKSESTSKDPQSGRAKKQEEDIYPGIRASFDVTGSYANFRKFLHALETNKIFLVVQELSLDRKENLADKIGLSGTNRRQPQAAPQPQSTSAEGDITIKLELRTYFRRQGNESY